MRADSVKYCPKGHEMYNCLAGYWCIPCNYWKDKESYLRAQERQVGKNSEGLWKKLAQKS